MDLDSCDRTVQSRTKNSFATMRLVFPEQGVATFARSKAMKVILWVIILQQVVVLAALPLLLTYEGFPGALHRQILTFAIIGELIFALATVGIVTVYFRVRPLVFDRNQGRLWRHGSIDPVLGDYAVLKDVAGLQICSQTVRGSEGQSSVFYELNLVLNRPPGGRVPLICHANKAALFDDARGLAEFLRVPLVVHST